MALTPLQEIFVLLEDEKKVPLYRINRWGTQARGVLGKLTKYRWIKRTVENHEVAYQITPEGEKAVDKFLKPLKQNGNWDGRWRLVMFDIPERKRALRDRLRRSLANLGLGILQASVWITPMDIKKEIREIAERLELENTLRFFEVSRNQNLDQIIIEKSWNLPELENDFLKFNISAEHALKNIEKDPNARFRAKKLIFEYALLLQKDPRLPLEFRSKDDLRKKAQDCYLRLREFAV